MKISKFQFIVLGLFIVFIIAGVIGFATYRGTSQGEQLPPIAVWGTFPEDAFTRYVAAVNLTLAQPVTVNYTYKNANRFSDDFISALARGQGPDVILIPADMLLPHEDKLVMIPFSAMSQRSFLEQYVSEAEVYLNPDGIAAVPFSIDPLIMYWNRDMFDVAGLATYPRYWDEFGTLVGKLTVKDQNGNVRKSAVAMGDFSTVVNARELLGTLFLQVGNPVTGRDAEGTVKSTLRAEGTANPETAVQFFTQFANPTDPYYSWNRGMPNSKSAFLSGVLATYFGFASELSDIREKNPNLNFDAAPIPQLRKGGRIATYGRMYGLSIARSTANANAAYQVVSLLTSPAHISQLSSALYLPSVRRDLIAQGTNDAYISVFDAAALVSKTWLDASPEVSRQIMGDLVRSVGSGEKAIFQAVRDAADAHDVALEAAVK